MTAPAVALPLPPPPRPVRAKMKPRTLVAVFVGALVGLVIVAIAVQTINPPPPLQGCAGIACPVPPGPPRVIGLPWKSDLGLSTEYPADASDVTREARLLEFHYSGGTTVRLEVAPASEMDPTSLLTHELDLVRQSVPSLDTDCVEIPDSEWSDACPSDARPHVVLGPAVGYVDGIGGIWGGTSQSGSQVHVVVLVSQHDGVTASLVMSTTTPFGGWGSDWQWVGRVADNVSNSIVWPGDQ